VDRCIPFNHPGQVEQTAPVKPYYRTFGPSAGETIRTRRKPAEVLPGGKPRKEVSTATGAGRDMKGGGLATLRPESGNVVKGF
jgi:hypothetical protein